MFLRWVRVHLLLVSFLALTSVTAAAAAGPYYFYSPSNYVYEAAPDHSYGWRYWTQTRVEFYQWTNSQLVTMRYHYWNIVDQGVDSNCQIDWWQTPDSPDWEPPFSNWYDYWNTPVGLYGFDWFYTPYYGDGRNSLTEMYYGWTDIAPSWCPLLFSGWGPETGGWIIQTFKKSGSWRWYACKHNAGDLDCPNWR